MNMYAYVYMDTLFITANNYTVHDMQRAMQPDEKEWMGSDWSLTWLTALDSSFFRRLTDAPGLQQLR